MSKWSSCTIKQSSNTKGISAMKIVNKEGKLFGLINVIDLVIIVAVLIVGIACAYKFLSPTAQSITAPKSDMIVTMRVRGAMDYLEAEMTDETVIKAGDKLVGGSGFVDGAEIVKVESEPYVITGEVSDGTFVTSTVPDKWDIVITVKCPQAESDPIYKIGTQEIRIGRGFILKTQKTELNTIIETVEFN